MQALNFLKNPVYKFLFKALALYVLWYIVYEMWLHPMGKLDIWVIKGTLKLALGLLNAIGFHTFTGSDRLIGVDGTNGLWMGDNCDSIELCALFAGFIIAFPGAWLKKLWFVPLGVILICLLNVIRVGLLAIIEKNFSYKWLEFNHTYTFTAIVYFFIFMLWLYWVKKLNIAK